MQEHYYLHKTFHYNIQVLYPILLSVMRFGQILNVHSLMYSQSVDQDMFSFLIFLCSDKANVVYIQLMEACRLKFSIVHTA